MITDKENAEKLDSIRKAVSVIVMKAAMGEIKPEPHVMAIATLRLTRKWGLPPTETNFSLVASWINRASQTINQRRNNAEYS